jgi:hypothetical protein
MATLFSYITKLLKRKKKHWTGAGNGVMEKCCLGDDPAFFLFFVFFSLLMKFRQKSKIEK